jgi:hypothetical protein
MASNNWASRLSDGDGGMSFNAPFYRALHNASSYNNKIQASSLVALMLPWQHLYWPNITNGSGDVC